MNSKHLTAVAMAALVLLSSCGSDKSQLENPVQEVPVVSSSPTVGVKNFRQLQASLTAMTGIPSTRIGISSFLNNAKSRLPVDGRAEKVSPSSLLAVVGLVGAYCSEFVREEAKTPVAKRKVHGQIDFFTTKALTLAARAQVIDSYAQFFWRRTATESEKQTLLEMMAEVEKPVAAKKKLFSMLLALCSATGSSADAIRL